MATQTQTQVREEPPISVSIPVTGHAVNVDEDTAENIRRALGSDHADPPDEQPSTEHPSMAIPDPWKCKPTAVPPTTTTSSQTS
jgi:hypothetical protein